MAAHKATLPNWGLDKRTWIFYQGLDSELNRMADWCRETYGDDVEIGTPDMLDQNRQPGDNFQMSFAFKNKKDAMVFRLRYP